MTNRDRIAKTTRCLIACTLVMLISIGTVPMALAANPPQCDRLASPPPPAKPKFVRRGVTAVKLHTPALSFSQNPTDLDLSTARIFSEPLTPMSSPRVTGENPALAKALVEFKKKSDLEDLSDISRFLAAFPNSRWRASLELNLGQICSETGYLSNAMTYWKSAWDKAKKEKGQSQAAVADAAISQLVVFEARLGRMQDLENQFDEIKHRPFRGSDETRIYLAKRGLALMKANPAVAFKCGPYAVNSLWCINKQEAGCNPILYKAASTIKGTSLWQLKEWASKIGLNYQPAKRGPHAALIVPCVMHWKVGHFAALTEENNGKFRINDATFDNARDRWISKQALEAETDGYFLVPDTKLPAGWCPVAKQEAETIWGKGNANSSNMNAVTLSDPLTRPTGGGADTGGRSDGGGGANSPPCTYCPCPSGAPGSAGSLNTGGNSGPGMAQVGIHSMQATPNVFDTPLAYSPPVGPSIDFRANYNYLETNQPSTYTFSNLGKDWTIGWLSYLTLDASKNATVRVRGGGSEVYTNTGSVGSPAFAKPNLSSQCQLSIVGGNYQRLLPNGTIEVFNDDDGSGRIFMTQVIDPYGNAVSIQYDSHFRISTVTDAIGQSSTFTYATNTVGNPGYYNITQISDPFGRTATFAYDSSYAYLLSITDQIGLVSQFTYDTSSTFITAVTTPYGTTSFYRYTPANPSTYIPTGLRMNFPDGTSCVTENWSGYQIETYYWNREAMGVYPYDYANSINPVYSSTWHCAVTQWQLEAAPNQSVQSTVPNWDLPVLAQATYSADAKTSYYYNNSLSTGDRDHFWNGPSNKPNIVTRNGAVWQYQYNTLGRVTQTIDPLGRTLSYTYASNNIDLTQVTQTRGSNSDILGQWVYNPSGTSGAPVQHRPLVYINASGGRTSLSYNSFGQVTQVADPNSNVWTYSYSGAAGNPQPVYLTQIQGPLSGSQDVTTFSYDGYGRVYTATNAEGYTLTFSYDNMDRLTQVTYPDGTYDLNVYNRLDLVQHKDRLGRWSQFNYDCMDQLVNSVDPLGRKTQYSWCTCGGISCLTDPLGHQTTWQRDLEGRVTGKTYPDGTQYTYAYNNYGVLQSRTDALSQVANYSYNTDYSLAQVTYANVINPTSAVAMQYDINYPRIVNAQNDVSGLLYTYNPYSTSGTAISTMTLGGSPHTGDVISVTVGSTTPTNVALAGTPTTGNVVNVLVLNSGLSGGKHNVQYTVQSSDTTLSTLASSVASAINSDSTLSSAHISASASSSNILLSAYSSTGAFSILPSTNGTVTETVAGTIHAGDVVSVTVFDAGIPQDLSNSLPAGQRTYTYTVGGGDTTSTIAHQLQSAISADSTLSGLGITASWTSANSYFTINSTSVNQTQYSQGVSPAGNETITLSGGPTETAPAAILAGAPTTVNYTVQSSDTTLTILAASIASAINVNTALSNAGVASTANAGYGVIYLSAPISFGIPTVTASVTSGTSETITTAITANINVGGTPVTGDTVNLLFKNASLTGGTEAVQYTVQSSDTSSTILGSSIAGAINSDSALSTAGIRATANGAVVSITAPSSIGTVSVTANNNGVTTETVGGTVHSGDVVSITVFNAALTGGQKTESHTVAGGDTTTTIANDLASKITTDMTAIGITASNSSNVITITSAASSATFYAEGVSGTGATTTIKRTTTVTETVGGTMSVGDVVSITTFDSALPVGQKTVSHTVGSGDTTTTIATDLKNKINADSDLTAAHISATSSSNVVTITSASGNGTFYLQAAAGVSPNPPTVSITQAVPAQTIIAGGQFGLGGVHSVENTAIANSTATYIYDSLGRTTNRSINGSANSTDWGFDQISRVTQEVNPLGTFGYTYMNDTSGSSKGDSRLASISYPNGQTTNFSWLPNIMDQRLQQIVNLNPSSAVLSQFNYAYDPAGQITQWQQQQNSTNKHYDLGYDMAGQLTSAVTDSGSSFKAYVSGTVHTGDVVSVTAYDASLTGSAGQETASYTVQGGDTLTDVATGLKNAINSAMSNISTSATSSGSVISISTSPSYTTSFSSAVTGSGATTTVSVSGSSPIPNLHTQLYYSYDCAGNRTGVQGDSSGSFPTGLTTDSIKATFNCTNALTGTSAGGPIAFQATTTNPVKAAAVNVNETATIGGTITAGDTLTLVIHDPGLSQAVPVLYIVQSGDTTTTIATAIKNAINGVSVLSSLGISATSSGAVLTLTSSSSGLTRYNATVSGGATETLTLSSVLGSTANISPSTAFTGSPTLASGANTASVTAVSGGGTRTTNTYPVTISSASSTSLTYDNNGNCTSDGTNTYAWDAENRLIEIDYSGSGNKTTFTYDCLGNRQKIVETTGGSVTSTKVFVFCGSSQCEQRDASNTLQKQFFALGQQDTSTPRSYFYAKDHLGSVREMTHGSGGSFTLDSQFAYDPYGQVTQIAGSGAVPEFQFTGLYQHSRSGLNLTMFRQYNSGLGRWLSRDPLGLGMNLYRYVASNPITFLDPLGLSEADAEMIRRNAWASIHGMTQSGQRLDLSGEIGGNVNNAVSAVQTLNKNLNPYADKNAAEIKGCADQATVVHDNLVSIPVANFDDPNWTYTMKQITTGFKAFDDWTGGATHSWIEATSGNPSDPILIIDPWKGTVTVQQRDVGEPIVGRTAILK